MLAFISMSVIGVQQAGASAFSSNAPISVEKAATGDVAVPVIVADRGVITITCNTEGAEIRYTTDGSDPDASNGIVYSDKITDLLSSAGTVNIRVRAYKDGAASPLAIKNITVEEGKMTTPVIFVDNNDLLITCASEYTKLKYSTKDNIDWNKDDKSDISGSSYSWPGTGKGNTNWGVTSNIYSRAFDKGKQIITDYAEKHIVLENVLLSAPEIAVENGIVSIYCPMEYSKKYYTLDGSDPASSGTRIEYTGPFAVEGKVTVKAVAYRSAGFKDGNSNDLGEATSEVTVKEVKYVASPGIKVDKNVVTLTCGTDYTKIKYTTNGTVPSSEKGSSYNGPIDVDGYGNFTLTAIAYKDLGNGEVIVSDVVTKEIEALSKLEDMGIYTFNDKGAVYNPAFSAVEVVEPCSETDVDGVSYNYAWKPQAGEELKFVTTGDALLKVVFADKTDGNAEGYEINIDGETLTANGAHVGYMALEAGTHKLTAADAESMVAYIGVFDNYKAMTMENDDKGKGYSTLYYDYPISVAEGMEAYTASFNTEKTVLTMKAVKGVIPANTAVVVRAEASSNPYYIHETGQTGSEVAENVLRGSLVETDVPLGGALVLAVSKEKGIGFYNYKGGKLGANKAYIPMSELSDDVKSLSVEFPGGETTAINVIETGKEDAVKTTYNLNGQRVNNMSKPGMYIINGKKVIVK